MGNYVYKYVLNEEIVYIGKCDNVLRNRLKNHKSDHLRGVADKCDIYFIELANSTMTDVVESELIRRYKPKYNRAKMSEWCGIEFNEPEWKKFEWSDKEAPKKIQEDDVLPDDVDLWWAVAFFPSFKTCYITKKPISSMDIEELWKQSTFDIENKKFGICLFYRDVKINRTKSKNKAKEIYKKYLEEIREEES